MTYDEIKTKLRVSINGLKDQGYTFNKPPCSGYSMDVYLDPADVTVYISEQVGAGRPMAAFLGQHVFVISIPERAIPVSVVDCLLEKVGSLASVVENYEGLEWDGHNHRGQWKDSDDDLFDPTGRLEHLDWREISCYHDAIDWYEPLHSTIEVLAAAGRTAQQIVEEIGTGDDYEGRVDKDEALEFVIEHLRGEVEGGRCECGVRAVERQCSVCNKEAWVIDCGCLPQPRPISAGKDDGTELDEDFCEECGRV